MHVGREMHPSEEQQQEKRNGLQSLQFLLPVVSRAQAVSNAQECLTFTSGCAESDASNISV